MSRQSVEHGWQKFLNEVLAKKFPDLDSPEYDGLRTICSLAYHSGAHWVMALMKTEGLTEDAYQHIRAELDDWIADLRERARQ